MAKGLKYLLPLLLLGCALKVKLQSTHGVEWCSEKCDKYIESSSVYFGNADFYQCQDDPYSLCMLDCQNLPATDTTHCWEDLTFPYDPAK